jgi:predicted PurR-regulated permease PerM
MAGLGFTVVGGLTDCLLVIVAGIYLAADPDVYRRGLAKLFPPTQHGRIEDALDATGTALRLWFGGQLLSMSLVGAVYGLAFWFIGLPSPLALGVMAGVLDFIPYLGPILGAIPALILASTVDTTTVLWTLAAVVIIQQLEGNVLMPVIQRRAVELPPALGLFAIVVFGLLFGFIGVFLAVPLTVAIMVLVKKLWIRETLGEATTLPGEGADRAGS